MYTYYAFNGNSLFRGGSSTVGFAYTGTPAMMPNLSPLNYANFKFGTNNISFPRINYQVSTYGANSNLLRFKKGGFDSGMFNITSSANVSAFAKNLGTKFNITGVMDIFEPVLQEEGKQKKGKSFEEIVNLILNYGSKAVSIAQGLGLIKNKNQSTDDGWGNIDGLDTGVFTGEPMPQEKPIEAGSGTVLGFKTENVLLGVGGVLLAIAVFKK